MRNALRALLRPDENADKNGGYHVRSLYFDDDKDSALYDKLSGVETRRKYRIRIYNCSDRQIRLERKLKRGEYINKDVLLLTIDEYKSILSKNINFLLKKNSSLAEDMYIEMKHNLLVPKTIVDYHREAFVHRIKDIRITFDSQLKTGILHGSIFDVSLPTAEVLDKGIMILEVKFSDIMPNYLKAVINNAASATRSAVSKYVFCRKYD